MGFKKNCEVLKDSHYYNQWESQGQDKKMKAKIKQNRGTCTNVLGKWSSFGRTADAA